MKKGGVYAAIGEAPGKNASVLTASSQQSADAAGNVASSITLEEVAATANEMAAKAEKTAEATKEGQMSVDRAVTQMSTVGQGAKEAQKATEEVRKLAEQSEDAARKITDLIGWNNTSIGHVVGTIDSAISAVGQGVELVNVAGGNFREIGKLVNEVVGQVGDISKALQKSAEGSRRIVASITVVENLSRDAAAESQNVSAATEEQSASMEEIAASSQALAKLAQDLQTAVAKFRI